MAEDGSPSWIDYGRPLGGAEEAVGAAIEQLITEGGAMLRQKYLERKAFGFAASAATSAILSGVELCYVPCDPGEEVDDDWVIEEEPEPGMIDSWARMHLSVRRQAEGGPPGTGLSRAVRGLASANRSGQGKRFRETTDMRQRSSARSGKDTKESRSMPLQDDSQLDEEEEQLREEKAMQEVRKREQEREQREVEKREQEREREVALRHEEMRRRPHTFDQDGNVIWVEEFKVERLPKVQEFAGYNVRKDARARSMEDTLRSTATMSKDNEPASPPAGTKRKGTRSGAKKQPEEPEFTDGFSKLQHGQPPILETMVMQSGVTLEAMGRKKAGAADLIERHVMSRKEYNRLAANESAVDFHKAPAGGSAERRASELPATGDFGAAQPSTSSAAGGAGGGSAQAPASGAAAAAVDRDLPTGVAAGGGGSSVTFAAPPGGVGEVAGAPPSGTTSLPPLRGARTGGSTSAPAGGGGGPGGGPNAPPPQRAPPAPPMAARHLGKKFEAMGALAFQQRAPRYHVPQLGGPQGFGSAQPPLGATMGHGLMRHGSLAQDYFFPPQDPLGGGGSGGVNRSASDTSLALGSGRRAAKALGSGRAHSSQNRSYGSKGGASKEPSQEIWSPLGRDEDDGINQGRMHPETTSAAYRNFRFMLNPDPAAQTAGGDSNFGARY